MFVIVFEMFNQDVAYSPPKQKLRKFYKQLDLKYNGGKMLNDQTVAKKLIQDIKNGVFGDDVYDEKDLLFFQEYIPAKSNDDDDLSIEQEFCFVYQNGFMREMLQKYGQDCVCLDATYKVTKV